MPLNDFANISANLFERVVLTQAAISAREIMEKWLKDKESAVKKGEPASVDLDRGGSRAEISERLTETFKQYHCALFKYASQYNKRRDFQPDDGRERVFQVAQLTDQDLKNLRAIFDAFVQECYDETGRRKPQIDDLPAAARAMQKLYETLKTANNHGSEPFVPLRYMRFAAGVMIAQLGSSEKWRDVNNGQGIDFNRGARPQAGDGLETRFLHAFSGGLDEENERQFARLNNPSKYIHHHESFVEIEGYRFPCLRFGSRTHLVTDSGCLVDMTEDLQRHIFARLQQGGHIDDLKIPFTPPQASAADPSSMHISQLIKDFHPDGPTEKHREHAAMANESLAGLRTRLAHLKDAAAIDGRPVEAGTATLVSMDIDLLTGLSMLDTRKADGGTQKSETARLGAFVRKHSPELRAGAPGDVVAMSDFLALFPEPGSGEDPVAHVDRKLSQLADIARREGDADSQALIALAAPHIKAIAPRVMMVVEEHFKDKKTAGQLEAEAVGGQERKRHETPRFYLTVGGVAAGKSNAERIAGEECGQGNYVIAGLDMVRSRFDRQAINLATDNHNFDYRNIEQAGKLVRAVVLERGRKQGYHLLLDGSGIPYENRYAPILRAFKGDASSRFNYNTNVIGFDRTLYVHDPQRRSELDRTSPRMAPADALLYQGRRIGSELRAVPVKMIASNYAAVPEVLLQASQDPNVDRFWLIDNNPRKSHPDMKPYILSFTAEVTAEQLQTLEKLSGAELKAALCSLASDGGGDNGKVAAALGHERYNPDDLAPDHWNLKVVARVGDTYRIEVITDAQRYLGMLEKGLLNLGADGPESLFKLTRAMSFDVEGMFQNDRRSLQIQPDSNVAVVDWMSVPYATDFSLAARKEPCCGFSSRQPRLQALNPPGQTVA